MPKIVDLALGGTLIVADKPAVIVSDSGQVWVQAVRALDAATAARCNLDMHEVGWTPADKPYLWFVHRTPRGPWRDITSTPGVLAATSV